MDIQDIPRDERFRIRYSELACDANIHDDGRFFHATSDCGEWCCIGIVVDYADNIDNLDPVLQVNGIYSKAGSRHRRPMIYHNISDEEIDEIECIKVLYQQMNYISRTCKL